MAKSHALTGVALVTATGWLTDFSPATMAFALVTVPAFALFNDIDHPNSMVSTSYGFVSRMFSLLLVHRRETHSFPGIALIGLATWAATIWDTATPSRVWLTLILVLAWAALLRTLGLRGLVPTALPVLVAVPLIWLREELAASGTVLMSLDVLPLVVIAGMLAHVVGDCPTNTGCPLWWPFSKRRTSFRVKLRPRGKVYAFSTNSVVEHKVVVPLLWLGIAATTFLWLDNMASPMIR